MTNYHNVIGSISSSVAVGHNYIVDCPIRLGSGIIIEKLEERDYAQWIKAGTVNSQAVNPLIQSSLRYMLQLRELVNNCVITHLRDATVRFDMRTMYAKLFFNALLRHRFALQGIVPDVTNINNNNTYFEYCNTANANLRPTTLSRYATLGYISFFSAIDFPANRCWLLEILGVRGAYFNNPRGGPQIPAAHYLLPGIKCVYFDNAHHDHINPDTNAQTIYGATVALARTRGEVLDAMHGLQMAYELVYASAHIHLDQRQNAVAFDGNRHSIGHDATMNLTDGNVDDILDDVVMDDILPPARNRCDDGDEHIDGLTDISDNEGNLKSYS